MNNKKEGKNRKFIDILSLVMSAIAMVGLILAVYLGLVRPAIMPKPKIEVSSSNYFISDKEAGHDITIRNIGNGTAHDISYYIEFKSPYKIISSSIDPLPDKNKSGIGTGNYHLTWEELPPENIISIRIVSEADRKKIESVFPLETKLSDSEKIIDRIYSP